MISSAVLNGTHWIDNAMQDYYHFLSQKYKVQAVNQKWYSITTPFLNMFNDCIELYCCQRDDGKICLSDDGETFRNLDLVGVTLFSSASPTRKVILNQILLNYGVKIHKSDGALYVVTELEQFPQAKLNLLKAIMEISDMYVLSRPNVQSAFRDDVRRYLDQNNIIYTPQFIAKGRSGLDFTFTFQIAGKKKEILINTFGSLTKGNVTSFLFDWEDIRQVRESVTGKEIASVAIINDVEKKVDDRLLDALHNKGADYILYSQRNKRENLKKLRDSAA